MEEIIRFYERRIAHHTAVRDRLHRQIYRFGTLRLLLFAGAAAALWLGRGNGWATTAVTAAAFALPFVALMIRHTQLAARKTYAEAMIRLNAGERQGIDYDFSAFDGAPEKADARHPFALDLDLFGDRSLFQSINRTVTEAGKSLLADWFMQPLTDRSAILRRREAVGELAAKTDFRQHFYVTGSPAKGRGDDLRLLTEQAGRSARFTARPAWRALTWLVPAGWMLLLAGAVWQGVPPGAAGWMFVACLLIANLRGRSVHRLHKSVEKMEQVLRVYSQLMEQVEKEPFLSEELACMQQSLMLRGEKASQAVARLSRIIGALDQRFSMAGLLLNVFYLRDMRQAIRLEGWLKTHVQHFGAWFGTLAATDALCSLGGFAFNHPDYAWPEMADGGFRMEGKALGHPLLHREKCVRNGVSIPGRPCFLVITGANMAGKSTYLRTVGVNFLLACTGLPVCADSLTFSPASLMTSLRTADSLTDGESYFFAELKRLKAIIDRLHAGEELFVILDETLKGTNSEDRQKGSLALIRQLMALKSCGLIATHDLLLGTLEEAFPGQIENYCFEADISGDELLFSYRLRKGTAANMNACFLMKKMGIILGTMNDER
ncbi:MAG: DNA mismatch repair protein MutS [Tannerella sp.]|jgi:hypothetical protein|nr:DNA mismatch repair protein MutS [Tannerella sp.]